MPTGQGRFFGVISFHAAVCDSPLNVELVNAGFASVGLQSSWLDVRER